MKRKLAYGLNAHLRGLGRCVQASAQHAFVARYDASKLAELTGVVVKIEWLNPHIYFFVDVQDESTGFVATWAVEMGSPVVWMRRGRTRSSIKISDVVTVEGILAGNGSTSMNAQSVILVSTGQKLFTRSAYGQQQVESEDAGSAR